MLGLLHSPATYHGLHSSPQTYRGIKAGASVSFCAVFVCFYFVSLCRSGCPGTHCIDQTGLELTKIHLLLPPPNAEIKGGRHVLCTQLAPPGCGFVCVYFYRPPTSPRVRSEELRMP